MMENVLKMESAAGRRMSRAWPSNDNRRAPLPMGRSVFPEDAVARIYRPSPSVTTSGKGRIKGWRLRFEPLSAPFVEPLMGYTGGGDVLAGQVELTFPTLEAAIRYAERQGLSYAVEGRARRRRNASRGAGTAHAFSGATLEKLGLKDLRESYGRAMAGAVGRDDPPGPESWAAPMAAGRLWFATGRPFSAA